jgi:hypothetical protein
METGTVMPERRQRRRTLLEKSSVLTGKSVLAIAFDVDGADNRVPHSDRDDALRSR